MNSTRSDCKYTPRKKETNPKFVKIYIKFIKEKCKLCNQETLSKDLRNYGL